MNAELIYTEARITALEQVKKHVPDAMNLRDAATGERFVVQGGCCGFAWVQIKPANCAFAKFMVEKKYARKWAGETGVCYWIGEFGQSMSTKEIYADAFAQVLRNNGIYAYSASRMD